MAKYERRFHGDFDAALAKIHDAVINGSYSASYEDGSDYVSGDFRCAVRVYERYSLMGDNYLSLTLTLVNDGGDTFASAISAAGRGGGLGISIHWGEDKFLEIFSDGANMFQGMRVLEKG